MMSGGVIGGPGLGYAKDRFASAFLERTDSAVYAQYKVAEPRGWMFFHEVAALDGHKLGEVQARLAAARQKLGAAGNRDPEAALALLSPAERQVYQASIQGDRETLKADAAIPAVMAVIYLGLLLYFRSIGGYQVVHLAAAEDPRAETLSHG
jgi:hypothetical protein